MHNDPRQALNNAQNLVEGKGFLGFLTKLFLGKSAAAQMSHGIGQAQAHLNQARAQSGNDVMAALLAGELGLTSGGMKDAQRDFQTALRLGGKAAAEWGLLRVHLQQNHLEQVQQALRALDTLSPMHSGARLIRAHMAWKEGSKASVIEALRLAREVAGVNTVNGKTLVASKTDRAAALSLLGLIHEHEGRLGEANQAFLAALVLDADRDEALLGAGRVLLRDKRPGDALARFEMVIKANSNATSDARMPPMTRGRAPFVEATLGAAEALLAMGRPQMAKEALEPLLKEHASDAQVSLWLGKAEVELEHTDVAEKHFQATIRLAPSDFAGYLALSQLYVDTDEPAKAAQVLRQAEGRVPDSAERRRMVGRSELAREGITVLLTTPESFGALMRVAPNLSSWLGGFVFTHEDPRAAVEEQRNRRLAALRAWAGKTDEEVLLAAEQGRLPRDPEYGTWLVLLGRGDLLDA